MGKETHIRTIASAVIRRVLTEPRGAGASPAAAVDAAYPFGLRQGRPYQIWRDEARRALAAHPDDEDAAA